MQDLYHAMLVNLGSIYQQYERTLNKLIQNPTFGNTLMAILFVEMYGMKTAFKITDHALSSFKLKLKEALHII